MTKKELIEALEPFSDDAIVICKDLSGEWGTVEIEDNRSYIAIIISDELNELDEDESFDDD